jgi:hypothetical protein
MGKPAGEASDRNKYTLQAVRHVIERIVAPLGIRVDESSPWVDARLSDGSRVQTRFLSTLFVRHDKERCRRIERVSVGRDDARVPQGVTYVP